MPHSQGLSNNSYPEPNQPNPTLLILLLYYYCCYIIIIIIIIIIPCVNYNH